MDLHPKCDRLVMRERERNKEISEATFYIERKERENKTIYKKILSHSLIFLTSNHFLNKEKYKNKTKAKQKKVSKKYHSFQCKRNPLSFVFTHTSAILVGCQHFLLFPL